MSTPQIAERTDPWLTADAAAAYLSCPIPRVRWLVKTGQLQAARNGRRLMFRRTWLDAALTGEKTA